MARGSKIVTIRSMQKRGFKNTTYEYPSFFIDDFYGKVPDTTNTWTLNDTSSAGTPTQAIVATEDAVVLTLDNTSEAQTCGYDFGDKLQFDIDRKPVMICKFKTSALTTAQDVVVGLGAAWNDTLDSNAAHAWFRLVASHALVVESDDGTNDNDDTATGVTMVASTYKWIKIDTSVIASVKFYTSDNGIKWTRVASGTTFDMSNYSSGLQPMFAVQKASGVTTPSITVDLIQVSQTK